MINGQLHVIEKHVICSHCDYSKIRTLQRLDPNTHWYSPHEAQWEASVGSDTESFVWPAFERSSDIIVHHNKWWSSHCPQNFEIVKEHHILQLTHRCEERETCSAQKSFGWEPYTSCDIPDSESFIDSMESDLRGTDGPADASRYCSRTQGGDWYPTFRWSCDWRLACSSPTSNIALQRRQLIFLYPYFIQLTQIKSWSCSYRWEICTYHFQKTKWCCGWTWRPVPATSYNRQLHNCTWWGLLVVVACLMAMWLPGLEENQH